MRKWFVVLTVVFCLFVGIIPANSQDEFVFGVILVGPKNDHGWSQSHYEGGEYVMENLPGTKMLAIENVYPGNPEITLETAVSEMVAQGAKLIFTTSDEFELDTDIVAASYPEVVFINTTGDTVLQGAPKNVGDYNSQFEAARMVSACAAGLASQTGKIGYLGALINQETRRHAASAYLAAKYCWENYRGLDPVDLQFTVTWIGFWFNIPGVTLDPTEVANTFYDSGADVVMSGIDTTEALVVAGQRRTKGQTVWAIPTDNANGCDEAPEACLGAPYLNWGPPYLRYVKAVINGSWKQGWEWESPNYQDFNDPDSSPIGFAFGSALTEEQIGQLQSFIAEMGDFAADNPGYLYLWQGPLNLQDGTPFAAEDELVDPMAIWTLSLLLEGMIGASE